MRIERRKQRGGLIFTIMVFIVIFGIIGGGAYVFSRATHISPFSTRFYESRSPEIAWETKPKGLGGDPVTIKLDVSDSGAGLDEVVVRLIQKEQPQELVRKSYRDSAADHDEIPITLDGKALGLKEGQAQLTASVFDKSIWSNGAHAELPLIVDFSKPRVEVLTPQQNANLGGVELVFYKVLQKTAEESGVMYNGTIYKGFQASAIDPSLKGYTDLYFAFFPIPYNFDDSKEHMRVVGKDDIGNLAFSPFNYRINKRKWQTVDMPLSDDFLNAKVQELFPLVHFAGEPLPTSASVVDKFKAINETLRAENDATLRKLFENPVPECLWKGRFERPLAAAPKATFAEHRLYKYGGTLVTESLHMGFDLADVSQSAVHAANSGKVIFAGELGIYGNAVVIDHGCGIASLYGHLSQINVKVGDSVAPLGDIGKTGATGLAGGDHLHFEIRVHGVPVTPIEWWDNVWVTQHIDEKLAFVKRSLIGGSAE